MLGMIQDIAGEDPDKRRKARLTVKSYILQEAEAAAREAKMGWCKRNGWQVWGMQHDGILIGGTEVGNLAEGRLTRAAQEACAYDVRVVVKAVGSAHVPIVVD